MQTIVQKTDPTDEAAVSRAVDLLNEMRHAFSLKGKLLKSLRAKVKFADRGKYVQVIARQGELNVNAKFKELKDCKAQWAGSSAALDDIFKGIGLPLVQIHADDFVTHDYFSGSRLKEVSDFSGVPMTTLALELIGIFAAPDSRVGLPAQDGRANERDSLYEARPDSHPKPADAFGLDYDFDRTDVQHVARIFDVVRWEGKDALTAWVRKLDKTVSGMYERGGRYTRQRDSLRGMTARHHGYGQQLGWHGLFLVAGELVAKHQIANSRYSDGDYDEWQEWLDQETLTRKDGLWIADGVDVTPIDSQVNLKEKGRKGARSHREQGKDSLGA